MPRNKAAQSLEFEEEDNFELDTINAKFVYELARKNDRRGRIYNAETGDRVSEREFKPRVNCLLRSAIVLNKEQAAEFNKDIADTSKHKKPGKHLIEYYDGCTTLFSDEHPKDKDVMEQYRKSTREVLFINGYVEVYGYDTMLKLYLDICSWNGASEYRVKTVEAQYIPVDSESVAKMETESIDLLEKALDLAKTASAKKMRIHGKFLGISEIDIKTGNAASPAAMRAEYRKAAKENPAEFIRTYNDKSLELKAWITKGLDIGEINTSILPNQAVWKSKGSPICDVSGLTSREGILNKLIEFAKSEAGADFNEQLRALYN